MRVLAGLALAVSAAAPAAGQGVRPWTEAVVSVRDLAHASRLFSQVGGWTLTHRGTMSRGELTYWKLPTSASARFERWCAQRVSTGCIRFVRFAGVKQRPIRLAARAWDTGGIYSIMVRSNDVQVLFDRAIALGWWAESEPVDFTFGASTLKNVVLQGPDGLSLAVYERKSPPFTAFPLGLISQGFNSMRMVRDQRAAVRFYRDVLGFKQVFDSDYRDPEPQQNNFSLPHNMVTSVVRRASALQPADGETGRIEVMEFVGLQGKDASAFAVAPNLGVLSVRYPVRGLAAFRATVQKRGANVVQTGAVEIEGRTVPAFAVRDPDGSITEFYEATRP